MEPRSDGSPNLGEQIDELLYRWDEARRRPVVVAGALAAVVVVLALAVVLRRPEARTPIEDRIPQVALEPTSAPTAPPAPVLVHVAGAVRRPGVYELAPDARVRDAIAAAGGATPAGQPDRLNLAAPVVDGTQVRVPVEGEAVVLGPSEQPAGGPIDLNRATVVQLESLPGIGPATAAAIVEHREEVGAFAQVADLLAVRGIGEAKLAAIEDMVVVR